MQATLLGLGIAIILALVAALVGPHFIDWSAYRPVFEARASDALGVPVRIAGRIDMRLLPTPAVTLNGVETVEPRPRLRARTISAELALGALLRGEWRVTELAIRGPDLTLGLDRDGRIDWPGATPGFEAGLSIERLDVEEGRLRLAHAGSGAALAIDRFAFHGDVRSLAGPIKGEGEFVLAEERYGFRLTTSRRGDDGNMRARLTLTPAVLPFAAEVDGQFRVDDDGPKFDGALTVSRAAGVVLAQGRARQAESWRANARLKANARQALFEQIELQYGPDERALKLAGVAELKLASQARLDAVLSARQFDLDQFIAADEPRPLPLRQLARFFEPLRDTVQVPLPVRLGLAVDVLTVGGAPLQNLQLDAAFDADKIAVERFELRAPGATHLRASGALRATQDASFSGSAVVEAQDPRALAAWLEAQPAPAASQPVPLRASGEVLLAPDKLAIERLSAQVDGKPITGRLVYETPSGKEPRLEAELRAAELDIDAASAALVAALPNTTLRAPAELALSLDLGRAVLGGIEARGVAAKLVSDAARLRIERLRIDDVAGATLDVSGAIEDPQTRPRGEAKLALTAERPERLAELIRSFSPAWAEALRAAGALGPVRLQGEVSAGEADMMTRAAASLSGAIGAMRIGIDAEATGAVAQWRAANVRLDLRADADDGPKLAALVGLDRLGAVQRGPASAQLRLQGRLNEPLRVEGGVNASGLSLSAAGTARLGDATALAAELSATLRAGDLKPFRVFAGAPDQPLPANLRARLLLAPQRIELADLAGAIGGGPIAGRLSFGLGAGLQIDGAVETEVVDLLGVAAALSGSGERGAGGWPTQAFEPIWARGMSGRLTLSAKRALLGDYTVRPLRAAVRIDPGEAAIEDVDGGFAGGRLTGSLVLQGSTGSLGTALRMHLTAADLAQLASNLARRPATGRVNLTLSAKGAGRSAAALMTTLGGGGTIDIDNLELAALAPQAFASVIEAVDKGATIDPVPLRKLVEAALEKGRLRVNRASAPLDVTAGQLRVNGATLNGDGADVSLTGSADLIAGQVDARLALIGPASLDLAGAGRPEIGVAIKGPLASAQRAIDVSGFVGWLTLRSVEQQAKRLEALEAERRAAEAAAAAARAASREATSASDQTTLRTEPRASEPPAETASPAIVPAPPPLVPPPPPSAAQTRPTPQDGSPALETNPNARTTLPPPPPRAQPRAAQGEPVPPLPPPVDIRPAPGSRRPNAAPPPAKPAETFNPRALFDSIFGR